MGVQPVDIVATLFLVVGGIVLTNLDAVTDFDQRSGLKMHFWFKKKLRANSILNHGVYSVVTQLRLAPLRLGLLIFASSLCGQGLRAQTTYTLRPTPKTVAWGYYDSKATPVLRIKSGDTVEIQTLITNSPKRFEEAGVPPEQVEQSLRDITDQVKDKGPGGHILTGPIYIEGAAIGDVLEVRILAIKLAIPYAYNAFGPGRGYLPDDYPYSKIKIIPLDAQRMIAKFAPGIEIPLHPFFGSMGDAPPEGAGRFNSAPPWIMGGNLDNKDLVAGTTLYFRCTRRA